MVWPFGAIAMSLAGNGSGAGKYIVSAGGLEFRHQIAPAIRITTRAAARSQANASRVLLADATGGTAPLLSAALSVLHFSSWIRSRAVCQRSLGSLANAR